MSEREETYLKMKPTITETLGTCSICHGRVSRAWPSGGQGKCEGCGAIQIGCGPLLPMARSS